MGQKVHPYGFRLGVIKTWNSKWFEDKNYAKWLHEDMRIKRAVKDYLMNANIASVEVERAANKAKVIVFTARPGMVIGKGGKGIEILKIGNLKTAVKGETKFAGVQSFTENEVFIDVQEIRKAETTAQLVAENVATQLERRVAFRRAMKKALSTAMKFGAKGIRIRCSGRLGGSEMSRVETYREGRVPLHTLRADIEFGLARSPDEVRNHRRQVLGLQGRGPRPPQSPSQIARAPDDLARPSFKRPCSPPSAPSIGRCRRATTAAPRTAAPTFDFGDFAMQAVEPGRLTARQIEAARMAITRHVKRAGKLWIRVFPDRPVTKKPLEVRMGGGKGGVEEWAADVLPGRVMYEISGVDEKTAREAFRLAGHKLPVGYKFLVRGVIHEPDESQGICVERVRRRPDSEARERRLAEREPRSRTGSRTSRTGSTTRARSTRRSAISRASRRSSVRRS